MNGGVNTYGYAMKAPTIRTDRRGLQARPQIQIPGYKPPDNAQEAATWFDQDWEYSCELWHCPQSIYSCGLQDDKKPTELLPAARRLDDPPTGCSCRMTGWHRAKEPETWASDDVINALYQAQRITEHGPSRLQRLLRAVHP